jgi:hypothetical protein
MILIFQIEFILLKIMKILPPLYIILTLHIYLNISALRSQARVGILHQYNPTNTTPPILTTVFVMVS